jgi:hypothetical protein
MQNFFLYVKKGLERTTIDEKTDGWYNHVYLEHNVYHLMFYMIYISKKHLSECDALEKQVKKALMENLAPNFVPIRRSVSAGDLREIDIKSTDE